MKVEAGVFEVEAGADEKQQIKFIWPNLCRKRKNGKCCGVCG